MKKRMKKIFSIQAINYALVGIAVFLVLLLLFKGKQFAPFGNNSLACMDAYYQYLDFFAYLKDVFSGSNKINYTFSIGLGQSGIGVFSYYLASPFNFLLVFFDKANLNSFFDIAVAAKLSTAAITMSVYLKKRFCGQLENYFTFLLSFSYALMQYNIAQASNIMWLDGVYMLPLILLGINELIREKKIVLLSISVALSIVFSWYSAGINCLFTAIWFAFELALENNQEKKNLKWNLSIFLLYIWGMVLGILISAFLFYPTVLALRGGKGNFDWWIFRNAIRANPLLLVLNYSLGAVSASRDGVSLYCGSLVMLGCIGIFCTRGIAKKRKVIYLALMFASLIIYYWQPLHALFSLLKSADSYWYRYSYISIFSLIFLAGMFFSIRNQAEKSGRVLIGGSVVYSIVLMVSYCLKNDRDVKQIYFSILFAMGISVLLVWCRKENSKRKFGIVKLALLIVVGSELCLNTSYLMDKYSRTDVEQFMSYEASNQKLIDYIKEDETPYRISNTTARRHEKINITANYDEAMNFNYWGIPSYTSAPDNRQMAFLERLGYRTDGACVTVVNTSILPVDSLLGVKYILSPYEIKGYEKINDISDGNKNVYRNPYVMPLAFVCSLTDNNLDGRNEFEYVNSLYSSLMGSQVHLFIPAKVETIVKGNTSVEYTIHDISENQSLYGNIPWWWEMKASINVNDLYTQGYSQWLSPSIFYIPSKNGAAKLTLTADDISGIQEEWFYLLDLDVMEQVSQELNRRSAVIKKFENGYISCSVSSVSDKQLLFLVVPYDKGWLITNSGSKVEPQLVGDSMIAIPLKQGDNDIVLKYEIPGLKGGILLSVVGVILLAVHQVISKKCCIIK